MPWPVTEQTAEALRRLDAAELVREAADPADRWADEGPRIPTSTWSRRRWWPSGTRRSSGSLAEVAADTADVVDVPMPSSLSATTLARLRQDRDGLARDLVRPMPRTPSPAARFGTRFHAWVEARFGQQQLVDPDELPGRADTGIDDEDDLRELVGLFEKGEFAERTPVAVEPPFALVLAGQVVRGRIDAVYADRTTVSTAPDGFLVVDWKTNRHQSADPLQLAVYRVAWAELAGVPVERVRAGFYYVRTGELVEPEDLESRERLEELLVGTRPDLTRRDGPGSSCTRGRKPPRWDQEDNMTTHATDDTTNTAVTAALPTQAARTESGGRAAGHRPCARALGQVLLGLHRLPMAVQRRVSR